MTIQLTNRLSADDTFLLEKIYSESFPQEERRPWDLVINPRQKGCPELFAIIADGHICGMATIWDCSKFIYIEHLAIDRSMRSNGIGSSVIREIIGMHEPMTVVLEAETPESGDSMASRRIGLYKRLGFEVIDPCYVQPPYSPELPSVSLYLMATAPIPPASTTRILHNKVYGCPTRQTRMDSSLRLDHMNALAARMSDA